MFSVLTLPFDIVILSLLALGCGIGIASHLWRRKHRRRHVAVRLGVGIAGWMGILGVLFTMYCAFIEPQIITVTSTAIPFPIEHPVRIAVISDLHIGPYKGRRFIERLVNRINQLLPDIVILDGDFILSNNVTADELQALTPLRKLRPTA